jgi:thiamine-phosphate pyrophosphorylase
MTREQAAFRRIFDANWNRAAEGIRVVEDLMRLGLDDQRAAELLKNWRHELTSACEKVLPTAERVAHRHTLADVGTSLSTPGELSRPNSLAIASANLQRAQQAVRCLEEYAKAMGQTSPQIEALRYRLYDLQTKVMARVTKPVRLDSALLYILVDCGDGGTKLEKYCQILLSAGADVLQIRDKRATDRQLLAAARIVAACCREQDALSIVNDRPDIAIASGADGVHLGQEELPIAEVRNIMRPNAIIGVSTHSLEQLRQAIAQGADYVGCGPTFQSSTKSFEEFPGPDYLTKAQQFLSESQSNVPAFAIGGINPSNLADVLSTGFERVALAGVIHDAKLPAETTSKLKAILRQNQVGNWHTERRH